MISDIGFCDVQYLSCTDHYSCTLGTWTGRIAKCTESTQLLYNSHHSGNNINEIWVLNMYCEDQCQYQLLI